jgi:hypothetical protein
MKVVSNVTGVVNTTTNVDTGNIEFWAGNYNGNPGLGGIGGTTEFDYNDTRTTTAGYGSMQIHNYGAGQTIIAYNHWRGGVPDLGIGNNPGGGRPDWTFANSNSNGANQYTVKNLWVLAHIDGAVLTEVTPGPGGVIDFGGDFQCFDTATIADAMTLQNTGATNSLIDVFDYSITGPDASFFDVFFTVDLLQAGYSDTVSYDVAFLGGGNRSYSALLTINTSEGDVEYSLAAYVAPEPSTILIWTLLAGLGVVLAWRRRK